MLSNNDNSTPAQVSHKSILAVVLAYAIFAASWILVSDQLIHQIFRDPDQLILASMLKGWVYVLITSLLLYGLMLRWFGRNADSQHAPPAPRRLLLALGLLIAVILALMVATVLLTIEQHTQEEFGRLQAVAALKSRQIGDWLHERRGDADFIQTSEFFIEQYQRWQVDGDMHSAERLQTRLEQFAKSRGISAISVLNPQGERLWRSANAPATILPEALTAAELSTKTRQVQLVNPYRDNDGRVRLDLVVPLTARPIAAPLIVMHIDLSEWLFPVLERWPMASASGETLLFRRSGDDILYICPLRFRPDAAASFRLSYQTTNLLATKALQSEPSLNKVLEGKDYRNAPVIGLVQAIGGTDWLLLTKLDKVEIYAKARSEAVWIICVGSLTIFIVCAGFYLLRQSQSLALARAMQKSQAERLRALNLLAAISDLSVDAIYAKDLDGRYMLFNTAACNFVGKPVEEVLGQDDTAIFPHHQSEHLKAFGRRVVKENITLTEEETLDTRYGPRVFLATKGPLRDANGKVIGLFGISRDITERKQAELELRDSEARFRGLVEQSLAGIYIIQEGRFVYVNQGFAAIFGYERAEDIVSSKTVADLVSPQDLPMVLENLRRRINGEVENLQYRFEGLHRAGHRIYVEVHGRSLEYQQRPAVIGFILDVSARKVDEDKLNSQAAELKVRNDELERFNRAMVGRELDMVKLKQQVNALSKELGRQPPYALTFLNDDKHATDAGDL
ncbi:diguanylate cyclase/phosphodiesterase (GGDEF & EAL domains) with PAS/PAC sensor(s) [Methylomonas albis]|uniref:PAS domain S-box protein n=1 Tax=Methylomonas albis TaxID=1854563 RepID=A0ABR9D274_9GAMM|nr:PAS domain S-box protein [Methylomonas albis]MBD9357213.1 PAS domain S-box protein [Methylomonas albis]CAD6880442.1 diguanylate cyclase/phosphodiesterase (GGDEF & EAL domains) with PAS/PAC sensor(s) [Methylomonas albis]